MKGLLAWFIFGIASLSCLVWISGGVRDDMHENSVFQGIVQERIALAQETDGDLHIGVAGNFTRHPDILGGIQRATEELNAQGGMLGRRIVLECRDDHGAVNTALAIAQEFATRPEIPFVIGHTDPQINRFVAPNYEFYDVLLFSPNASLGKGKGLALQFSDALPANQIGEALLDLAGRQGWSRIGLIYTKTGHHQRQAQRFESLANARGVNVPLSYSYTGAGPAMTREMEQWKRELDLDAMLLSVDAQDSAEIILAARGRDIRIPIVSTETIPAGSAPSPAQPLGQQPQTTLAETNSSAAASVDIQELPAASSGSPDFGEVWVMQPYAADTGQATASSSDLDRLHFALGYETLQLLAQAVNSAQSLVPEDVATALRTLKVEHSPGGTLQFDASGDAVKLPPRFIPY